MPTAPDSIRRYEPDDDDLWDEFVAGSWNGTFLHTRRFLSYHGDRFQDRSLVLEDAAGRMVGVLPAALDADDPTVVVSHPGATYGGLVHAGALLGGRSIEALRRIVAFYQQAGIREVHYKAVPYIYRTVPAADDLYALFRLDAIRYRCDLSATIDVPNRPKPRSRRRRSHRSAVRSGVQAVRGAEYLKGFWPVLEDNLSRKHGKEPVHSLDEIELLQDRFPDNIECVVGILEDEVVAGTVLFTWGNVVHAQYIASSTAGYDSSALDVVFEECVALSTSWGARYFDFGTSTEDGGAYLNEGLYKFKTEFGAGGVVHEFYTLGTAAE